MQQNWPKPGVSAAIFRGDSVLLVERAKPPLAGQWSLPGGHVEAGETTRDAALRELSEETGVAASIDGLADVLDVILKPEGTLMAHYVITVFHGLWLAGEPKAASDVSAARFVPLSEVGRFPLTAGAAAIIAKARRLATEVAKA
jgi:8-oxo-dGTP diphosphatase